MLAKAALLIYINKHMCNYALCTLEKIYIYTWGGDRQRTGTNFEGSDSSESWWWLLTLISFVLDFCKFIESIELLFFLW